MKTRIAAVLCTVAVMAGVSAPASAVTWGIHSTHSSAAACNDRGESYTRHSGYGFTCDRQVTDHGVLYYLWTWLPD